MAGLREEGGKVGLVPTFRGGKPSSPKKTRGDMQAITLREHGGPEVLKPEEVPEPSVRPDQVLVRIRAVALNHLDIWVRKGMPHLKLRYPHILGCDIVGEVAEMGSLTKGLFATGQKVLVHPALSCGH